MFIDMERFTATDIRIDNSIMLLELERPDCYDYYVYCPDGALEYAFGTETRFDEEGLARLYNNGYFDTWFH